MTQEKFLKELEDSLGLKIGTISLDASLDDIEWDSLSIVIFIALADKTFNISFTPPEISKCKTVKDLINLLNGKFSEL